MDDALVLSRPFEEGDPAQARQLAAPFDLTTFLAQLAEGFRVRAGARGLGFSFDAVGDLPAKALGDAEGLRQALLGLAGNAFRFTALGRVELLCGPVRDRVRFELRDTGTTLSADDSARDPRFTEGAASGIDLATVQRRVAHLGGTLKFRNQDGVNLFWFDLPLFSEENKSA